MHAHPDDESIATGATMAKYAAEGAEVTLVTCTLGEEGEIIPPELAGLSGEELGKHRVGELDRACRSLGVRDHRFLGGAGCYRDSGMMGAPSNENPRSFWRADIDEAAHRLAEIVREVGPEVMVSYDSNGGYGHPDHIQAHRVAVRAFGMAADRSLPGSAWQARKLYAIAQPSAVLEEAVERLRHSPGSFTPPTSLADIAPGTPDNVVTTRVDARDHWPAKALAMRAHATQVTVEGERFALSNGIAQEIHAVEHFTLLRGPTQDPGPGGVETDLFA